MARIRVFGAAGGAVFALLTLAAFLIAPGPSSANGVMVVEYYTEHGNAAIWQAVLAGFGIVFFMWFAAIFADTMSSANAVLVTAGAMAAVYLVLLGAWESLGENYKDVDIVDVSSESYGDAHVLYDVGVGAAHLAGFADACIRRRNGCGATHLGDALAPARHDWRRTHGRLADQRAAADFRHLGLVGCGRRDRLPVAARLGVRPQRCPRRLAT